MKRPILFWSAIVGFVGIAAAMTFVAWSTVGGVRREAARNDARLRELAWSVIAYADAHGGFPLSSDELRAFAAPEVLSPEVLSLEAPAGARFPTSRAATAYDAETPPPSPPPAIDECLGSFDVEWGLARDVQPILRSKGKPTLQGTGTTVGQWLHAMSERIRGG
jgi:hypothetical protein